MLSKCPCEGRPVRRLPDVCGPAYIPMPLLLLLLLCNVALWMQVLGDRDHLMDANEQAMAFFSACRNDIRRASRCNVDAPIIGGLNEPHSHPNDGMGSVEWWSETLVPARLEELPPPRQEALLGFFLSRLHEYRVNLRRLVRDSDGAAVKPGKDVDAFQQERYSELGSESESDMEGGRGGAGRANKPVLFVGVDGDGDRSAGGALGLDIGEQRQHEDELSTIASESMMSLTDAHFPKRVAGQCGEIFARCCGFACVVSPYAHLTSTLASSILSSGAMACSATFSMIN